MDNGMVKIDEILYLRGKVNIISVQRDQAVEEQAKYHALAEQLGAEVKQLEEQVKALTRKGSKEDAS